ncbi:protein CbbY [Abditibacteriota bacterium]|nr:protein CbbY [Abditibacteriota bacterium]
MLEALLFDLDGTLIDTNAQHARAFELAFREYGYAVPADRIKIEIGKGGDELVPALLGADAEAKDGDALRDAWERHFLEIIAKEKVAVCPGSLGLLHECKRRGYHLALATSGAESVMDALEKASGVAWREQFEVVTTSEDAPHSKPAPHILLTALHKLGLAGTVCAMVGDTPYDALASRGAGVACVGVETGGHKPDDLREAGCRIVFKDCGALLSNLDEALQTCSPLTFALSSEKIEALMREALGQSKMALEQGEFPLGAVVADAHGKILARAIDTRYSTGEPLQRAELRALQEARNGAKIVACPLEPDIFVAGALINVGMDCALFSLESPLDGATHRLSAPRAPGQKFPRFVGGTFPDESRSLLEQWQETHPDDANIRAILDHAAPKTQND